MKIVFELNNPVYIDQHDVKGYLRMNQCSLFNVSSIQAHMEAILAAILDFNENRFGTQ